MSDFDNLVERYLATWNETDPTARRAAVDALFTEDATYVDPMAAVDGQAAIDGLIGAVQAQFPGFTFAPAGTVDAHHEQARFGWELGLPGQEAMVVGFDVVTIGADGRLQRVLGFLDKVPAA